MKTTRIKDKCFLIDSTPESIHCRIVQCLTEQFYKHLYDGMHGNTYIRWLPKID